MTTMRAKFVVTTVANNGPNTAERVSFRAVAKSGPYPADGTDEDNSFARWSPDAQCSITIANPNLWGKFKDGDKFYVDFTPAP